MIDLITALFSRADMDERFIMHRYYSTRIAMIVGLVLIVGWFIYEMMVNDNPRWDLFVIVMAIALTKVAAMIYFRITH